MVCVVRTKALLRISLSMTASSSDMMVPVRMNRIFRYRVFQITRAATLDLKKKEKLSRPTQGLAQGPSW